MSKFEQAVKNIRWAEVGERLDEGIIVDTVRDYFNKHNIPYESFSFVDLKQSVDELKLLQ